jgi:hypothetical protein
VFASGGEQCPDRIGGDLLLDRDGAVDFKRLVKIILFNLGNGFAFGVNFVENGDSVRRRRA